MNYLVFLTLCTIASAAYYYKTPPDDFKGEEDELKRRIDCFLDRQPCLGPAAVYKEIEQEAIREACAKCTPHQKELIRFFLEGAEQKFPEDYKQFVLKYDPAGIYLKKLEKTVGVTRFNPNDTKKNLLTDAPVMM